MTESTSGSATAPSGRELAGWGGALRLQAIAGALLGTVSTVVALAVGGYFWARWAWFVIGLALAAQIAVRGALSKPGVRGVAFAVHARLTVVLAAMEVTVWALSGGGVFWPMWALLVLGIALGAHAWVLHKHPNRERELTERVDQLTRTRRGVVDVQAAELKRIERDLHDGAQARMASLAMNLGLAEELVKRGDSSAVASLLAESRSSTLSAMDELRTVMRGIQPPVLSDRGLVGAVEALALDLSVPTNVIATVPGRVATPVESAVYLAISECLANVAKHSNAAKAWVVLRHRDGVLSAVIGDDGVGDARLGGGSGLTGIVRRLEVFDGSVEVRSPAGGPTEILMEVPCELSSPRTSSSSETE